MPTAEELGSLDTKDWNRLHELINRFEDVCKDLAEVDLGLYLPAVEDPLHLLVLQELIKSDLDNRWRRGQPALVEDYLARYPQIVGHDKILARLVCEEYQVRQQHGDRPALSLYQARFPGQFAALEQHLVQTAESTDRGTPLPLPRLAPPARGLAVPVGGGYTLLEKLGEGQFGQVWKAEAPGGKLVAVKLISTPIHHPAARRERESLDLIKNVNHPYLLEIHNFYPVEDRLIVIMGLAERSLRDRFKECQNEGAQALPTAELLRYMQECAEALDYLHEQGIQHRDVKPGNVLLSGGHVRIGDLGLAKLLKSALETNASILGTPPYMAPETWLESVHTHSDQYSLAVMYLELRRGRCPFRSGSADGILAQHLADEPALVSLTDAERAAVLRAGRRDPAQRFPSCQAFVAALAEALAPPRPLGYRKLKRIGKGVFGEVWRAEAPGGVPVAIKVIALSDRDKLQSELGALELIKQLEHQHLVTIHAFWFEEGELHIAMTLAECSLRDLLNRARRQGQEGIAPLELLALMTQAAEALDYLHDKGVVHRDVKPENILLKDGKVRVADFGLARMLEKQQLFTATTSGTMAYMPPEVWKGKTSRHSDQYSLAATYVELRLGRCLFTANSLAEVMEAHLQRQPPLEPLTGAEEQALQRALAKEPDQRWPSCAAFLDALRSDHRPRPEYARIVSHDTLLPPSPDAPTDPNSLPVIRERDTEVQPSVAPSGVGGPAAAFSRWVVALVVLAALVPVAGWLAYAFLFSAPVLELTVLEPPPVHAGEEAALTLFVRRTGGGPVEVKFESPDGIQVQDLVLTEDAEKLQREVPVTVADDVPAGEHTLVVTAAVGGQVQKANVRWRIKPLKTLPSSGAGPYEPVPGSGVAVVGGKKYYRQIDCVLKDDASTRVRFLLIPESEPPFYIMQDKVWNGLFAAFAKERPKEVHNDDWKLGACVNRSQPANLGSDNPRWPVLRVGFQDAHQMARWLGGRLPTQKQWDSAGGWNWKPGSERHTALNAVAKVRFRLLDTGRSKPRRGPYLPNWEKNVPPTLVLTVGRAHTWSAADLGFLGGVFLYHDLAEGVAVGRDLQGPLPVGTASWDVSPWGCRDMSGNGFEWTRTSRTGDLQDREIERLTADSAVEVMLRGMSYAWDEPFRFDDANAELNWYAIQSPSSFPQAPCYVGFRVVVEP